MQGNKKQNQLGSTKIEMNMIKEAQEDQQDIIFKNYLIHPIKRVFDAVLDEGEITKLETVGLGFGKNLSQCSLQQKQLRYKRSVLCFTCKDTNSMLMAIYCLFLRNPKKDNLRDILQVSELIPRQKKSTVDKVLMTLEHNMHYYLPTLTQRETMRDPLRQQTTQPLLMSYTTNSNQLQINSKLILEVMSVIRNKLDQIILQLIKQGFESRQLPNKLEDFRNGRSYCFTFGKLTDQIMIIYPYKKKSNSDEESDRYKLFLFQNSQSYSTFITKQKRLLEDNKIPKPLQINSQMKRNLNPEKASADVDQEKHPKLQSIQQQQGNITEQTQQRRTKQMVHKKIYCQIKEQSQINNKYVVAGQIATQPAAAVDVDVWEDNSCVGAALKLIFGVVILFLYFRITLRVIIFPHDFGYLKSFLFELLSCLKPLLEEFLHHNQVICWLNSDLFI